jgi:diadenosine tetraphosphatase ApaH/serine/threonine PP2A family protein phosphatase
MLFENYAPATLDRIGEARLELLRALPESRSVANVGVVHASSGDLWRAPMPDASEEELASTYSRVGSQIVIYGHIHRPFVHQVGALTVANAGSVGLPWDGDSRASYLLIEDHRAEVIRVKYAVETEVAALRAGGYPDADRIAEMLRLGRFVRVARW